MHPRSSPLGMTIALARLERAATMPLRNGGTALDAWIVAAREAKWIVPRSQACQLGYPMSALTRDPSRSQYPGVGVSIARGDDEPVDLAHLDAASVVRWYRRHHKLTIETLLDLLGHDLAETERAIEAEWIPPGRCHLCRAPITHNGTGCTPGCVAHVVGPLDPRDRVPRSQACQLGYHHQCPGENTLGTSRCKCDCHGKDGGK